MHKVLVNRLGGLGLPRKSVVRLTDRPDMTLDVYRGRKTTMPTTVGILTFMSRKKFMLSGVEHEKSFITSGPVCVPSSI